MAVSATKNGVQGELLSTGTTAETKVNITDAPSFGNQPICYIVRVISGTVKFGIGSIASGAYALPTGLTLIFTCLPGQLICKQSNTGDTFVVTCARDAG